MNAVALAGSPALTRRAGAVCVRCGEARPAGHVHCYVCGRRIAAVTGRLAWLRGAREWRVWAPAQWVLRRPLRRQPLAPGYGVPRLQLRTWGDRTARWYTYLSLAVIALWTFAGPARVMPAAAAYTPTEACTWLDTQRVQATGELERMTAPQRQELAQRLSELASRLATMGKPA